MLTRHLTAHGARWALDGRFLTPGATLEQLLELRADVLGDALAALQTEEQAGGPFLPPIEDHQEVWASGVTYLRSRVAREEESESSADVYSKVYDADRPELFFKCNGWRVVGDGTAIRIRSDSTWDVPEPELTLIINRHGEIVGYTIGNDVSSRSIEGENPLYLPQAKLYNGCCALGPGISLAGADLTTRTTDRAGDHPRRQHRLPGSNVDRTDETPVRGIGRLSLPRTPFPPRQPPDDWHRDCARRRLHVAVGRQRQDHHRRPATGQSGCIGDKATQ